MNDRPPSPAPLAEDELREMLDLLGTVTAGMSDRLDAQGSRIEEIYGLLQELWEESEPEAPCSEQPESAHAFDWVLTESMKRTADPLVRAAADLRQGVDKAQAVFERLRAMEPIFQLGVHRAESRRRAWSVGVIAFVLGAAIFSALVPRVAGSNGAVCELLGGVVWAAVDGRPVCVFESWK